MVWVSAECQARTICHQSIGCRAKPLSLLHIHTYTHTYTPVRLFIRDERARKGVCTSVQPSMQNLHASMKLSRAPFCRATLKHKLSFTYLVIHAHAHAPTGRPALTRDGLAALSPRQTSDRRRAEKMKGKKLGEMCVCVCELEEKKKLSKVFLVPGRILHGAKQIISSSAARVISSKQRTVLWTGERLKACPVILSLLSYAFLRPQ